LSNQTRSVCWKNSNIGAEWGKNGKISDNTEYTRSQKGIFTKKKSDETKSKEASERRYQRRSNVCPDCNMLKAVGVEHEC
jgi:hypothetical protein